MYDHLCTSWRVVLWAFVPFPCLFLLKTQMEHKQNICLRVQQYSKRKVWPTAICHWRGNSIGPRRKCALKIDTHVNQKQMRMLGTDALDRWCHRSKTANALSWNCDQTASTQSFSNDLCYTFSLFFCVFAFLQAHSHNPNLLKVYVPHTSLNMNVTWQGLMECCSKFCCTLLSCLWRTGCRIGFICMLTTSIISSKYLFQYLPEAAIYLNVVSSVWNDSRALLSHFFQMEENLRNHSTISLMPVSKDVLVWSKLAQLCSQSNMKSNQYPSFKPIFIAIIYCFSWRSENFFTAHHNVIEHSLEPV